MIYEYGYIIIYYHVYTSNIIQYVHICHSRFFCTATTRWPRKSLHVASRSLRRPPVSLLYPHLPGNAAWRIARSHMSPPSFSLHDGFFRSTWSTSICAWSSMHSLSILMPPPFHHLLYSIHFREHLEPCKGETTCGTCANQKKKCKGCVAHEACISQ